MIGDPKSFDRLYVVVLVACLAVAMLGWYMALAKIRTLETSNAALECARFCEPLHGRVHMEHDRYPDAIVSCACFE